MKGIKYALLAALISGVSIYVNKFAIAGINPLTFTATKNFAVGLLIIGVLVLNKKWQLVKELNTKEIIWLVLIGVIGGALPFYLFFTGLSQTSAINAAIIQKTLVIWVAILAVPFLKERLSVLQIAAVALLFYSNIFIGGFKGFSNSPGEMMIFAATILWAVETVIAKKVLKTVDPDLVVAARMGLGAMVLLVTAGGFASLTTTQFSWILVTAIILFAYVSVWYRALKFAPATAVTAVLVASTLVTNVLSTKIIVSQNVLMLAGLVLLLLSSRRVFPSPLVSKS